MPCRGTYRWLAVLPGLTTGLTQAAPVEGDVANLSASVLGILGVLAILLGVRNLRFLRQKHTLIRRKRPNSPTAPTRERGDMRPDLTR